MAGVAVSGTLVGAVLETAGYLTQEKILASFQQFFQSTGVLLFTLACIGAVISVALFGSYRSPRYLLVGPILFYFLTGVSTPTGGVAWQLGGGTPRTPSKFVQTQAESSAAITALAQRQGGEVPAQIRRDDIQVAWVFKTFTQMVSNLERGLSDLILQHENDQNLIAIARTRALESLADPSIADGRLLNMIQGDLLVKCNDMFAASQELSSPGLSISKEEELQRRIRNPFVNPKSQDEQALQIINLRREYLKELVDKAGKRWIKPTEATKQFMALTQSEPTSAARAILERRKVSNLAQLSDLSLTCGETWEVTADAVARHAKEFVADIEKLYEKELPQNQRGLLCVSISQKLGNHHLKENDRERCDLVAAASVFLIRKAISQSATSKLVQRFQNEAQFLQSARRGQIVPLVRGADQWELASVGLDKATKVNSEGRWEGYFLRKSGSEGDVDSEGQGEWLPIAALNEIAGDKDTGQIEHQRLQARELRQKIFSVAMLIPQIQAVILYFLTIAYPFLALIVVLPGRAMSFLNFFFLWLWVKSWGVGFSMVIVLDQVLWNLFPTYDFDEFETSAEKLSEQPLSEVLSWAFKIDPTFHTHAYYFFLSMAMLSIPVLSAYAFLKGKDAVFSAFTDGLGAQGDDAAKRVEGAFGIFINNRRMQNIAEMDGVAILSHGHRGVGLQGEGRGQASYFWGTLQTMGQTNALRTAGKSLLTSGITAELSEPARFVDNQLSFLTKYVDADVEMARTFDSQFGRWGMYQMMADAAAAGLDGDGGFEINENIMSGWIGPRTGLAIAKMQVLADYGVDMRRFNVGLLGRIPVLGEIMRGATVVPALKDLSVWLKNDGNLMPDEERAKAFNKRFLTAQTVADATALTNSLGVTSDIFEKIWDGMSLDKLSTGELEKPFEAPQEKDLRRYSPHPDWVPEDLHRAAPLPTPPLPSGGLLTGEKP